MASIEQHVSVPFLDLGWMNAQIRDAFLADVVDLSKTGAFTNGEAVGRFEQAFAEYCGSSFCVGAASGLDALRLGLVALDLEPGADVIVPAMTFVATWEAVSQAGGVPRPVDVSPLDYGLDVDAVRAEIGERTGAILPVHLYGQLADMDELLALSASRGLPVVEDAAQAHGAERAGRRAGSGGRVSAFSFYPGKNLGAFGDAGAVVTNDPGLAARARSLREHGQTMKYQHDEIGWTARLDTIQASVLLHKLPLLDAWNEDRRAVAALYLDALDGVGDLVLPSIAEGSTPVWHVFVIRTVDPTGLGEHLARDGIGTGRHYPEPPHLSRAYASLRYPKGSFPVAETIARECLSLPVFPGMTESQVHQVAESVKSWFSGG